MDYILSVKGLTHSFDNKKDVLKNINLDIKQAEMIAITGKSGSGKSTLLNIISGFIKQKRDTIYLLNKDINNLNQEKRSKFVRENIGFIFQKYNLINSMSVIENIQLPLELSGVDRNLRYDIAYEKMEALEIEELEVEFPKNLSGGQQQRVAICRALINNPKIILADEPTGNLDSYNSNNVMDILYKINKELGTTIIIVTHDNDIAVKADRIINIKDGQVFEYEEI